MLALFLVFCLVVPFFYYTHMVYTWCHENKPANYKCPEYKQLWMTGVGAITWRMMIELVNCFSYPVFSRLIENKGDDYAYERKV